MFRFPAAAASRRVPRHRLVGLIGTVAVGALVLTMSTTAYAAPDTDDDHGAAAPAATSSNVARGILPVAVGEGTFNPGEGPEVNLTDGDPATRSGGAPLVDFSIDLGEVRDLDAVVIKFQRFWDGPNEVFISDDGANWKSVITATGTEHMTDPAAATDAANTLSSAFPTDTSARFVRFSSEREWVNILEFEVYAHPHAFFAPVPGTNNFAAGSTVTAVNETSFNSNEGPAEALVDGDPNTFSGGMGPLDLVLDLGRELPLTSVLVRFQRFWDGPNTLSVSSDGESWTVVAAGSGPDYMADPTASPDAPNTFGARVPDDTSARYVRFAGRDWTNIFEFEVYSSYQTPAEVIKLSPQSAAFIAGTDVAIAARVEPAAASRADLEWSIAPAEGSSGSAQIDSMTGIISALEPGEVVVTARSRANPDVSASQTVRIDKSLETWRAMEFAMHSDRAYASPLMDIDVTAIFTGPDGQTVIRQGFWDGSDIWKVRFAAPAAGDWTVSVTTSDPANSGLTSEGSLTVAPYSGELELYERGFVGAKSGTHNFTYADGTPFVYVGDTHWHAREEAWDSSNVEGVPSQFKYGVDHRASQGFTVYQSQPIGPLGGGVDTASDTGIPLSLTDGVGEFSLDRLHALDDRFAYIADAGLLHTNGSWQWGGLFDVTDEAVLDKLGVYWQARYGAYPVMWTSGQEIDPDFFGRDVSNWKRMMTALSDADAYGHPLTAHTIAQQRSLITDGWGALPIHDWYAVQTAGSDRGLLEDAWNRADKPVVSFEGMYENNRATTADARRLAWRAFTSGSFGVGYGAQGVWAINLTPDNYFAYGPYYRWFDGLNLPGGRQMGYLKTFLSALDWTRLHPTFGDPASASFAEDERISVARDGASTVIAYVGPGVDTALGEVRGLTGASYSGWWFDPRTGDYQPLGGVFDASSDSWSIPAPPTAEDWVILITDDTIAPREFSIRSEGDATTIAEPGASLQLSVRAEWRNAGDAVWSVRTRDGESTDVVTIDSDGTLTAKRDGVALACAEVEGYAEKCRPFVVLRQQATAPRSQIASLALEFGRERQIIARATPNNTWNQAYEWAVTEPDGSETDKAGITSNGVLSQYKEGEVLITARATDGSGVVGTLSHTIVFNDVITNPLLQGAVATASTSDWQNDYRPQKALTSTYGPWVGWTSATDVVVSADEPQWLQVDLPEPRAMNAIEVHTTGVGYQLRSYDIQVWTGAQWLTVGSVRDSSATEVTTTFAPVSTDRYRILAFEGDGLGIARISALEPRMDATATAPPIAAAAPVLTGQATVGSTLTLNPGSWTPSESALSVVWLRDGNPIDGATGLTYRLQDVDAGVRIRAVVEAEYDGARSWAASEELEVAAVLSLEPTVTPRCLGGKVYLYTSVKNADNSTADITVTTPYGSKTFPNVKAGKTASAAFNSRLSSIVPGEVVITGSAANGATHEVAVSYSAHSCN